MNDFASKELAELTKLKDIEVFFDVGARMTMDVSVVPSVVDYIKIFPNAEYHLFEPNPEYFNALKEIKGNIHLNNFGLGDITGIIPYDNDLQAFAGGEARNTVEHTNFPVKTLDWYVKKHNISKIDLLKIDAEGYDYKVLLGGKEALKQTRYIQFETWDNVEQFHRLLEQDFTLKDIGDRNILATRK